jgi:hypothetical protein
LFALSCFVAADMGKGQRNRAKKASAAGPAPAARAPAVPAPAAPAAAPGPSVVRVCIWQLCIDLTQS